MSLPDDPKIIEAGDLAELAFVRCILKCREHLTNGVIDRRSAPRWLAGIRGKPASHMGRLLEVGLVEVHPDGWCIPIEKWKKWNPSAEDVERKRDEETERKEKKERQKAHVSELKLADVDRLNGFALSRYF